MKTQSKISLAIDKKLATNDKKMQKYREQIAKRKDESVKNFPGKTVLELESVDDLMQMAILSGELRALKNIKRML